MTGTVGEDGTLRASGIWANPTGGFPGVTVQNRAIRAGDLDGTAAGFGYHTDIRPRRAAPRPPRSAVISNPPDLS